MKFQSEEIIEGFRSVTPNLNYHKLIINSEVKNILGCFGKHRDLRYVPKPRSLRNTKSLTEIEEMFLPKCHPHIMALGNVSPWISASIRRPTRQ